MGLLVDLGHGAEPTVGAGSSPGAEPAAARQHGVMAAWTCPECRRRFARAGQTHECSPAMTLDEYFSTGTDLERPIFDAVMHHLDAVGPVHVEPVSVGIFLKRAQTFAELRPMQQWVALSFSLPRVIEHPTIVRKVVTYHGRHFHAANLRRPDDLDDVLRDCLTEAYFASPD
jgi:hypothetical protein